MKKLINKNVIKAMTIGISALMVANSMNLTAFAGEGDGQTTGGNGENGEPTTSTPPVATQSDLSLALEGANDEKEEVTSVVASVNDAVDFAEKNIPQGEDVAQYDKDIITEAEDLDEELDNAGKKVVDENGNPVEDENGNIKEEANDKEDVKEYSYKRRCQRSRRRS